MFNGCTNLSSIEVNFTEWRDDLNATANWVTNVSPTGTFICPEGLPEEYGNNRIPTGWSVIRK
jgi:hypothetical protein